MGYNLPGVATYEPAATNLSVDKLASAGACEIERLRFLVRSPEEIVKLSAVEVTTANISVDGVPVRGGLRDPRFGPSAGIACATCHASCSKPCNGHFGHYGPLSEPLYNVHFVKQVIVWLRLICGECGEVQVDHMKRGGVLTMTNLREKQCRKCNALLMRSMSWDKEQQTLLAPDGEPITAKEALRRFCMVPDTHRLFEADASGRRLVHPRRLITTIIFVPSICLRPCVGGRDSNDVRGENDLTYRLVKIISCNELLKKKKSSTAKTTYRCARRFLVSKKPTPVTWTRRRRSAARDRGTRTSPSTSRCPIC